MAPLATLRISSLMTRPGRFAISSSIRATGGRERKCSLHRNGSSGLVGGERKVHIRLSREAIKQSPEFTGDPALTRNYEEALHRHYNRRGYWDDEAAVRAQVG